MKLSHFSSLVSRISHWGMGAIFGISIVLVGGVGFALTTVQTGISTLSPTPPEAASGTLLTPTSWNTMGNNIIDLHNRTRNISTTANGQVMIGNAPGKNAELQIQSSNSTTSPWGIFNEASDPNRDSLIFRKDGLNIIEMARLTDPNFSNAIAGSIGVTGVNTWNGFYAFTMRIDRKYTQGGLMMLKTRGVPKTGGGYDVLYPQVYEALGHIEFRDGIDVWDSNNLYGGASIYAMTLEDFTKTAKGTQLNFNATPVTTNKQKQIAWINGDGLGVDGGVWATKGLHAATIDLTSQKICSAIFNGGANGNWRDSISVSSSFSAEACRIWAYEMNGVGLLMNYQLGCIFANTHSWGSGGSVQTANSAAIPTTNCGW